jgi:hypothetical protein
MNDLDIIKQLMAGNHLSDSELARAKNLIDGLSINIRARVSPKNYIKNKVEHKIEDLFIDLSNEWSLKSGDIAPDQQSVLDYAYEKITDIILQWKKQNGGE